MLWLSYTQEISVISTEENLGPKPILEFYHED
jgi:hypothetical protein